MQHRFIRPDVKSMLRAGSQIHVHTLGGYYPCGFSLTYEYVIDSEATMGINRNRQVEIRYRVGLAATEVHDQHSPPAMLEKREAFVGDYFGYVE